MEVLVVTHSAKTFALASLQHIVERSTHSFHIRFSAHVLADTAFSKEFESCGGEVQLFDALQSFLSVLRVFEKPAACKLSGSNFSVLAAVLVPFADRVWINIVLVPFADRV